MRSPLSVVSGRNFDVEVRDIAQMNPVRLSLVVAAFGLTLGLAGSALAQHVAQPELPQPAVPTADPSETTNNKALDRRLERDEKALRELRGIVLKAQANGVPVEVKPAGPDPQMADLQARMDDLQQTMRSVTGQIEAIGHDLAQARQAGADAQISIKALSDRLDALEKQAAAATTTPAAVAGAGATASPIAASDELAAYKQAREILDSGDYAGGGDAFQAYLKQYPTSPRAPVAAYWLGRSLTARGANTEAAAAYTRSLKGWPTASWAPDALVQLAVSLTGAKRATDACKALEMFKERYAAKASPTVKARAAEARTAAACG